jgi:hypothetical protein
MEKPCPLVLSSMEGPPMNPEQPHNQKRLRSLQSHRPRASVIKAKQHPVPAPLPVRSAVPTDESTETSSDDENEVNLVENAAPSNALSEIMPRPEITEPAWIGKTFPLVTVRSPHHGTDKTIVYLARFDRVVGLCPFTRKTNHPKCFVAYVTVDRTDLKQGRKVRIHPGQMCTLVGNPERLFGISSIILISDNPPRQVK